MLENKGVEVNPPTDAFVRGKLGDAIYILTRPDIRIAQEIQERTAFETIDGVVTARPGDVVITSHEGERYPILKHTFLGAYRIIGRVGPFMGAERLIHVRRAWPIISNDAIFDYGADRGRVPASRGSWLYQSDDTDFGCISREVKDSGHAVIGPVRQLDNQASRPRFERWSAALSLLPPLLALLALLAVVSGPSEAAGRLQWRELLVSLNTALLLAGAGLMYWMKVDRWLLKSCVWSGTHLCIKFQMAVELLGQSPSLRFPGMSLWRAAQCQVAPDQLSTDGTLLEKLTAQIGATLYELDLGIHRCRAQGHMTNLLTAGTFTVILAINFYLLMWNGSTKPETQRTVPEIIAIWLPSVISATYSFNVRRHITERIAAMVEFARSLAFVRTRLFSDTSALDPESRLMLRIANLQLICRIVAQHSQRELSFALGSGPQLPM